MMNAAALPSPLSPMFFVAAAHTLAGLRNAHGRDRGPSVEAMLRATGDDTNAKEWHAAFIYHVGYWSHYTDLYAQSAWPLPATNDCNVLAQFAMRKGILAKDAPRYGDIALLWSPEERRFIHSAIVIRAGKPQADFNFVVHFGCTTLDGNVHDGGRLGGAGIHVTKRSLSPDTGDRFVRWVDLDRRSTLRFVATRLERCIGEMVRRRVA